MKKELDELIAKYEEGNMTLITLKYELLRLFSVVGRSEQLLEEQSNWLMANTSLEVEKIVDFKDHFK